MLCTYDTGRFTSFETGLIMAEGALIGTTEFDIFSIDPATCAENWRTHEEYPAYILPTNRGAAYLDGMLFRGTEDGRVLAYDFKTGKRLWETTIADVKKGEAVPAAPIAWEGLVFIGNAGGDFKGGKGRMYALDARTGKIVWEFFLVPKSEGDAIRGPQGASHQREEIGHRRRLCEPMRSLVMELDPVFLSRAAVRVRHQLPHHLPSLHHWARRMACNSRRRAVVDRQPALSADLRLLAQDICSVVRHGRGQRHRDGLPVRHQLERTGRAHRIDPGAVAGLRGLHGLHAGSNILRRRAPRSRPRAALVLLSLLLHGLARHHVLVVLDPRQQQLDAGAARPHDRRRQDLSRRTGGRSRPDRSCGFDGRTCCWPPS